MRYALVDPAGKVQNVMDWDGSAWSPPPGYTAILSDVANIGDTWDGVSFTKGSPVIPPEVYTADELQTLVAGVTSLAQARAVLAIFAKGLGRVPK